MKKFSIVADPNSFNHFGGYGSNKSGKSNKQRPEQRFYVDEQNIITDDEYDDECEDGDDAAMMNLFLSYEVKDFIQVTYPKEANKVTDMNDTVRFVDVLVDLLNEYFNPNTLGRVDSIYRELTFAILADIICVSHIDIWNLWVNGQWSDGIFFSLRHRITVVGDRA